MKVAIFGAGAIGGFLGVRLAQAGADVTFIARGPHLAAMQANGVTLRSAGETVTVRPRCVASAEAAGVHDYVVVTLKAHGLPAAAASIATMMGPDSALVTGINGIPYWYFYGMDGPHRDRVVQSVDPGGQLWSSPAAVPGDRLRRLSRPPRSSNRASSSTPTATASPWASPTARAAPASRPCQR